MNKAERISIGGIIEPPKFGQSFTAEALTSNTVRFTGREADQRQLVRSLILYMLHEKVELGVGAGVQI